MVRSKYDDGGFSGGNTDRPALQRLLEDVRAGKIDIIVVYKVDRLTRSLADSAKLVELFEMQRLRALEARMLATPDGARQLNTRSARSRPAWAPPTS
jgi:Resolvase, N terminal domain